jgi:hypothetical protein
VIWPTVASGKLIASFITASAFYPSPQVHFLCLVGIIFNLSVDVLLCQPSAASKFILFAEVDG